MKVFVLGSGGREHALGWKLAQSKKVKDIFFLPGNAGTSRLGTNIKIDPSDAQAVLSLAETQKPDLIVVGPEAPLYAGVSDALTDKGFLVFGPSKKAAMLEKEKTFAKGFMARYGVPTARYVKFDSAQDAKAYIKASDGFLVVKASGPALGKGVAVCHSREEALRAAEEMMVEKVYGESGSNIVVEELLEGEEISVLVLTDGDHSVTFPPAQDHKRIFDNDRGPNTGGMGAYAPAPVADSDVLIDIKQRIIAPTLKALKEEGIQYRGVLYFGLMLTKDGPKVLEFNCRFGDPETQPLMMLMDEDIVPLLVDTANGNLGESRPVKVRKGCSLCVVAAASGYPGAYKKGDRIRLDVKEDRDFAVFHAGTSQSYGETITSGGRVLGVTGFSGSVREAKEKVYAPLLEGRISFDGIYFRRDIGDKGIRRLDESF